jgi:hypothetical protein
MYTEEEIHDALTDANGTKLIAFAISASVACEELIDREEYCEM